MIKISLFDLVGVGIIIELPTGVTYSNQTGGTGCLHPEQEGAFLPVNSGHPEGDPDGIEASLASVFGEAGHFDDALADRVDSILSRFDQTKGVQVDRERLRLSHEAWVYVSVRRIDTLRPLVEPLRGVLTWPNSD